MSQRLAKVPINPQVLDTIIKRGAAGSVNMPADAQFTWWYFDPPMNIIYLVYEHESFEEAQAEYDIPTFQVEMRRLPEPVV